MTKITAHSGCDGTRKDSLESILLALELHADLIEVDVRMSAVGELRLCHDQPDDRFLSEKPFLRQAFELIADTGMGINCDIKEFRCIEPTLRLAEEYGLGPDSLFLTGSVSPNYLVTDPAVVERAGVFMNLEEILKLFCAGSMVEEGRADRIPDMLDQAWAYLQKPELVDRYADDIIVMLERLRVRGLNMPWELVTESFLGKLRARRIPLSLWTVRDESAADRVLAMDVFNMTTTMVSMAMERRAILQPAGENRL